MPKKNPDLAKFKELVKGIASGLAEIASNAAKKKKWRLAYVDRRSPPGGGSSIGKFRIEMQDGSVIRTESIEMDQSMAFMDIDDVKDKAFDKKWYGIKISVMPDGKHAVEFNYDPDCINDPTFYDVNEK